MGGRGGGDNGVWSAAWGKWGASGCLARGCGGRLGKGPGGPRRSGRKLGVCALGHTRGQLGRPGPRKCLRRPRSRSIGGLPVSPPQMPSWALLTRTYFPLPPSPGLLAVPWGSVLLASPHPQAPHLPPAPQLAAAIGSTGRLRRVHTLILNVDEGLCLRPPHPSRPRRPKRRQPEVPGSCRGRGDQCGGLARP